MPERSRKGPDPDPVSRMAALGATATPAKEKPTPRSQRRPATTDAPSQKPSTRKSAVMAPEQTKTPTYSARIELTTTPEQNHALEEARIKDRISKTARIRALIALYQEDERLRRRVDRLALKWR